MTPCPTVSRPCPILGWTRWKLRPCPTVSEPCPDLRGVSCRGPSLFLQKKRARTRSADTVIFSEKSGHGSLGNGWNYSAGHGWDAVRSVQIVACLGTVGGHGPSVRKRRTVSERVRDTVRLGLHVKRETRHEQG
jgi:hypothetical protein